MVLPSISPLSDGGLSPVGVPAPPHHFKPIRGPITNVRIGAQKILSRRISSEMSLAKIAGLKYEKAFLDHLVAHYPRVAIQPHLHFCDDGVDRTVIPDAFVWDDTQVVVLEVKSQHMPEAWWQLNGLYIPVLSAYFRNKTVSGIEVCRRFDPQLKWPGTYVTYFDLDDALKGVSKLGVLKWKPT